MRKLLAFILACLAPSPALAISESGKTIAYIGVDGGDWGYIHFTTALTGSCAFDKPVKRLMSFHSNVITKPGRSFLTLQPRIYQRPAVSVS